MKVCGACFDSTRRCFGFCLSGTCRGAACEGTCNGTCLEATCSGVLSVGVPSFGRSEPEQLDPSEAAFSASFDPGLEPEAQSPKPET